MPETADQLQPLIEVEGLHAYYGEAHVLHGVGLKICKGEVVTLLGRNGAGKTTTLKSIMGMIGQRRGAIRFRGVETIAMKCNRIARLGIAFCPEERGIFSSLTVEENLYLPPVIAEGGLTIDELYDLFPNLSERRHTRQGTRLSGGEQQMLAIARILRSGARVLLLDEPTEGLAPVIVEQIGKVIEQLKNRGFTVLLVEQNFHFASRLADRNYVMEDGRIVEMVDRSELEEKEALLQEYLGV
ncbi:ABC transporter ATP-binding protein [Pelagibius marinus]|uniref:ABC transporter ATP-binding protein n=1 Tax=Pelagibius marinus TaxID=2762760 RepID=UPI001872D09B|nr:ABC transporter ATP-binding protein [Pelagibius marinus]